MVTLWRRESDRGYEQAIDPGRALALNWVGCGRLAPDCADLVWRFCFRAKDAALWRRRWRFVRRLPADLPAALGSVAPWPFALVVVPSRDGPGHVWLYRECDYYAGGLVATFG